MATRLGFIGIGKMGSAMGTNLLKAGFSLTVHDIREEATRPLLELGARLADSPRAVSQASEVVMTCLPGPREVEPVALGEDGIIHGLARDGVYIDLSSNSPSLIRHIHQRFQERGCRVLDATVAGRAPLAWERELMVMVGGDPGVFQRCRPILEAIGNRIVYCGPVGNGMICKLMHNCINAIFRQAVAECFTLGVKAGVDAQTLWEVVRNGITCAGSEINRTMRNTWLKGDFDTHTGSLSISYKDTLLATELGREYQVPMMLASSALQQLMAAVNRGWVEKDSTIVTLLQEERAGVQVRISEPSGT
ncbi:MAG: NAD(P)-dependent oxidoreductase [Chloroflexi bacterium]|nr:NAD(P)-dependent oxidoreductase [Chloroflexota bacterium]